jgi:hypothetical protein
MDYQLECACGKAVPVTEGMAGTTVPCTCGRIVSVPSLVELRQSAGRPAYDTSPELFIPMMIRDGELPPAGCIRCGNPAAEAVDAVAECERVWKEHLGRTGILMFPILIFWRSGETREFGRDLDVPVPFKVCRACRRGLENPLPAAFAVLKYILAAAAVLVLMARPLWALLPLAAALLAWGVEKLAARRQRAAVRNFLQFVPAYGRLLEKYPKAHISCKLLTPEKQPG